jgi:hypothetical protein
MLKHDFCVILLRNKYKIIQYNDNIKVTVEVNYRMLML